MAKKASKRYRAAREVADLSKLCTLKESVGLLAKMPAVKFDETVELSFYLGVDPKQGDQMVRGVVNLAHGSGKKVTVLVFTENPEEALKAGAEYAGLDDLVKKIEEGWLDFDVAVATTNAMKSVRQLARILGPKGMMPNPKSGTVTDNIAQAVKDVKAGRVEFKMDKAANVSVVVGKRSFTQDQLFENIQGAVTAVLAACPASFKGANYIKKVVLSSTMSPGVLLDAKEFSKKVAA